MSEISTNLLPKKKINLEFEDNIVVYSDKVREQINENYLFEEFNPAELFENNNPINIEIGIGNGGFIAHYAKERPNENFIGFEVFKKIMRKAVKKVSKLEQNNVRLIHFDAKFFVKLFPNETISNFYVNFPDHWPKKRHHKRRILKTDFIELMRDKLIKGGSIYMVTDHENYAEEIKENLKPVTGIESAFDTQCVNHLVDYFETKYYLKFAVHTGVHFFHFIKV
jgi:tRNA (guanine-N7-)-methyltransferase